MRFADACSFSLDELKYEYPDEPVPPGKTAASASGRSDLGGRRLALPRRHPREGARHACSKELALIAELDYAHYFLTVHDIVHYARSHEHPVPGARLGGELRRLLRASASPRSIRPRSTCCSSASSRKERKEPPDIDVDFEHERREEVIQYIYAPLRPRPRRRSPPPSSHYRGRAARCARSARRWG